MDVVGERTLIDLLEEQASKHGQRTFVVHETQEGDITQLSFQELRDAALGLAAGMQSLGMRQGDRAFVFLRNTPDYVPLWFALASAGAAMVPGNIYLTEPEVEYQLTHCAPTVVITEPRYLPMIQAVCARMSEPPVLVVTGARRIDNAHALELLPRDPAAFVRPPIASDDLAEILYTSGTSSRPKGVMLTHANLLWCGIAGASATGLRSDDRVFNNKPLFHANCQDTVLSCLTAGVMVVIGERYSATRYLRQLIEHRVTVCSLSGMLCRTLLNQPASPHDTAHQVRFAGYAINISEEEINRFVERFRIPLRNGYGQSETMLYITLQSTSAPSTYPSIGRPAMEREVFIVDEDNRPVGMGEVGEIVVRGRPGRNLMLGYYRDEEATRAAFEGGWLHTGDLGSIDVRGNFHFFGRKKEVIKRSGENISAAEVEEVLVSHASVKDVAVVGVPDPVRDQAVKAFVVLHEDAVVTDEQLREYCRGNLAYFKVPEFIQFLEELPRNASGKVIKRELLERYADAE
jgi:crotonobetaine/carnitine-CoA ligase